MTVLDGQLVRTVGVDVRSTSGRSAVIVLVGPSVEGARYGEDRHRQIEAIDEADVVEVHALVLVEGDLGQRRRQRAPLSAALYFASAVTSLAVAMSITVGPSPDSAAPSVRDVKASRVMWIKLKASVEGKGLSGIVRHARPYLKMTVILYSNLMVGCDAANGKGHQQQ